MKRTISILLCMLIALSVVVSLPANAAESSSSTTGAAVNVIYFDANGWTNFSKIYCHIYEFGGNSFFGWQTPGEECKKTKGTVYSYDLTMLSEHTALSGGMKSGVKYGIVFSTNTGIQTYDTTIGFDCVGDTIALTGNQIENPYNPDIKNYEAKWQNNDSKYGSVLALTSTGNIVGEELAPDKTGIQIVGEWVSLYYNSTLCKPVEVLAKVYPKFGIKTVSQLNKAYDYAKFRFQKTHNYYTSELSEMEKLMKDAFYKAYPSQKDYSSKGTNISKWTVKGIKNKTYTGKAIKQKITVVKGSEKATFKVTYKNNKNAGKAKMIIEGTGDYKGTITKTFVIKRAANPVKTSTTIKLANYKVVKYTSLSVKPITVKKAKGKVVYKKASGSKNLTVKFNGSVVVKKGTKKGVQSAKVKVTAKGNKNYKSKSKTVNIKIVVC